MTQVNLTQIFPFSLQCSSTHESAHILSGNPKGAGDKAEIRNRGSRGKFGASDEEEEKDTLQLLSLRGPRGIEVRSKAKSDHYRNDLLKQIEEKKRLKQLQDDREKAADEELQNRVAQQRLAMYMEYLEERKRGDLIVKAKTTGGAPEPTKRLPFTGGHHALFDLPEGHSRGTSQVESVFGKGTCRPKAQSDESPVPGKGKLQRRAISRLIGQLFPHFVLDLNILANLSEVRKLMHHDHVEMLEKLLELHIQ